MEIKRKPLPIPPSATYFNKTDDFVFAFDENHTIGDIVRFAVKEGSTEEIQFILKGIEDDNS